MKIVFVLGAFCFLGVFAYPTPDQDVKLEGGSTFAHDAVQAAVKEKTKRKNQGTAKDRTTLVKYLLKDYDKRVNPDNATLEMSMLLFDFKVREDIGAIESDVWLSWKWQDKRLAWDPRVYGGVEILRLPSSNVWIPDVTLYNSVDHVNMVNCWEGATLIYPAGKNHYIAPCKMTSNCALKLKEEPYSEQECSMKFGSWGYDGDVLDVQLQNGDKAFDLSNLRSTSGFEVLNTTVSRNERFFPCCEEPYVDLTFNMTIKRRPGEELLHKL